MKKNLQFETIELKSLLVAKHFSMLDFEVNIIDRKKKFSFDDSFLFNGNIFDCGYHAVDIGRSLDYNAILDSLNIDWEITEGKRLLVFNNKILSRGFNFEKIKNSFSSLNKNLYNDSFLSYLESIYGSEFVKFSIENIAKSYTQNRLWIKQKLSAEKILYNIYPWFFPNNNNDNLDKIATHFHNDVNKKVFVRYPKNGGFMSITKSARSNLTECITKNKDDNYRVAKIDDNGILLNSNKNTLHIWPIDYFDIAPRFGFKLPKFEIVNFYLVSVILNKKINLNCNEILVGDKSYYVDRISSPKTLMGSRNIDAIQFECEHEDELTEKELINNLLGFSRKFLEVNTFASYEIKKVKIKRFNITNINKLVSNIVNFLENKNPQLVVLNRSLNYENLSDGIPSLIKSIKNKI